MASRDYSDTYPVNIAVTNDYTAYLYVLFVDALDAYQYVLGATSAGSNFGIAAAHQSISGHWGFLASGGAFLDSTENLPQNRFVPLVVTRRGSTVKMFRDGVLRNTTSNSSVHTSITNLVLNSYDAASGFGAGAGTKYAIAGIDPYAWSDGEVRQFSDDPFSIFRTPDRKIWAEIVAGTTHDLTGANSAQSNLAGSGIISQTHILSVQTSAQANFASAAAITQGHVLVADASVQTNTAASGAITQSHDLAGTASGQANASEPGAITQAHVLSGSASTQANTGSVGAITQGTQFVADPATQSNIAGTGAITQTHALAGANNTQASAGSGAAISQSHTLAAAASIQPNVASNGAISQGVVHDLAASATNQTNASSAGAITQAHVLVSAPSIQDSIAAASAIVQAHVLAALSATQLNIASTGAIEQFSGIPPVDAPAGGGPRLRTPHGRRPVMRNTARPRQLR